jgi:replicative DNA helicase
MADILTIVEREKKLSSYEGDDRVIKSTEIQELLASKKDPFSFKSKIPSLDIWLEGFEAGELVVVSGPTGHGKTTMLQTFSFSFFAQNITSLWFSYEMTYRQFLNKLSDELFVYMPMLLKGKSIDWIRDRIQEAKIKYGIRAVFIDHLHFLVDMAKIKNPSLEIGSIVRGLKLIALELNVVIFLVAHSTKIRFDQEPDLDSIRDSSFIPQDADIVLIVWRGRNEAGEFTENNKLKVSKSRRTGVMGKSVILTYRDKLYWEKANDR